MKEFINHQSSNRVFNLIYLDRTGNDTSVYNDGTNVNTLSINVVKNTIELDELKEDFDSKKVAADFLTNNLEFTNDEISYEKFIMNDNVFDNYLDKKLVSYQYHIANDGRMGKVNVVYLSSINRLHDAINARSKQFNFDIIVNDHLSKDVIILGHMTSSLDTTNYGFYWVHCDDGNKKYGSIVKVGSNPEKRFLKIKIID